MLKSKLTLNKSAFFLLGGKIWTQICGLGTYELPKSLEFLDGFFNGWMRSFLIFYIKKASLPLTFFLIFQSSILKREYKVEELDIKAW